jgi:LysM repeat protein
MIRFSSNCMSFLKRLQTLDRATIKTVSVAFSLLGLAFLISGCGALTKPPSDLLITVPTPLANLGSPTPPGFQSAGVPPVVVTTDGNGENEVRPTWTALPTKGCEKPAGWVTYTVQKGNTLSSIARWSGSTVADLTQINCIVDATRIEIAQILFVPREILPTSTPLVKATPIPTETPTATQTRTQKMAIDFFYIDQANSPELLGNEQVTVRWQVTGLGDYTLSWNPSAQQEVLSRGEQGEYTLKVRLPEMPQTISFVLNILDDNGVAVEQTVQLITTCPYSYFVTDPAVQAGYCPWGEPKVAPAEWQPFEFGFMVRHKTRSGDYVIGVFGENGDLLTLETDVWNGEAISWPTAPPAGLIQPLDNFGAIWVEDDVVRDALGWATADETVYEATAQKIYIEGVNATTVWGDTYLTLPSGRVVRYTGHNGATPYRWLWIK